MQPFSPLRVRAPRVRTEEEEEDEEKKEEDEEKMDEDTDTSRLRGKCAVQHSTAHRAPQGPTEDRTGPLGQGHSFAYYRCYVTGP